MAKDTDTLLHRMERAAVRLMKDDLRKRASETMILPPPGHPASLGESSVPMPWAAGQVAGLITGIMPVKEVIERMVRIARDIFRAQIERSEWPDM